MTLAEIILSLMVVLQPPGQSLYSLTAVEQAAPPACPDETSLLCRPPRWVAARQSWVRPETEAEGLARYAVIAGELAAVSEWASGEAQPEGWPELPARPWRGTSAELARALLTVVYHESGFREDVHSGLTAFDGQDTARGDGGRSWGLVQRQLGQSPRAKSRYPHPRWEARQLVGVDAESTRRCLIVGADVLGSAQERCRRMYDPTPGCLVAAYGGGGITTGDRRVRRRVLTLARIEAEWRIATEKTPPTG